MHRLNCRKKCDRDMPEPAASDSILIPCMAELRKRSNARRTRKSTEVRSLPERPSPAYLTRTVSIRCSIFSCIVSNRATGRSNMSVTSSSSCRRISKSIVAVVCENLKANAESAAALASSSEGSISSVTSVLG